MFEKKSKMLLLSVLIALLSMGAVADAGLRVSYPNGGQEMGIGKIGSIKWTATEITGNVRLKLLKDGAPVGEIVSAIDAAAGKYTWTTGETGTGTAQPGTGYKIRVETLDGIHSDESNSSFSLVNHISLTYPNSGQKQGIGGRGTIRWISYGLSGTVTVELLKDGALIGEIVSGIDIGQNVCYWTIGETSAGTAEVGGSYKIRLSVETPTGTYSDDSNKPFDIGGYLNFTYPDGGGDFERGSQLGLYWHAGGLSGNGNLLLLKDEVTVGVIAEGFDITTESYGWTIGETLSGTTAAGSGYKVRLETEDGQYGDQSKQPFSIIVSSPVPTVELSALPASISDGESATLTWTTTDAVSVSIDNGIGSVDLNGAIEVTPPVTTTYRITATGPGGTVTAEVAVVVEVTINEREYTAIYGRVFDDNGGSPIAGAVITSSGVQAFSDSDGRWQLVFSAGGTRDIKITKEGYTEVYRKLYLAMGKEGVVDDAYLTMHDNKITVIGPAGGTHSNTGGTVEVVIPQGALDGEKEIRATRLSGSRALPGDMNATTNLEYPISFLFCADFGPDGTEFNTPVTIRVRNTWGFAAGTQIPYAYYNTETQKWVPFSGMAVIDAQGEWLEAEVTHFTAIDCNPPVLPDPEAGIADIEVDNMQPDKKCGVGSSVDIASGELINDFSVPGVKIRGGSTGMGFVYRSSAAYPS
ncbi:MAG: carboxypeptidase regulatory-like domain-containing protein, partial [bacterium]|nr:carboxypeptidase regulatory-like domain-containing protein [bacterium]